MAKKKTTNQNRTNHEAPLPAVEKGFIFQPWHAVAALLILCIFFFSQIIFGIGNFWEDAIQLEFPNRVFAQNSFLHFEFPHWNPFSYNGMPFFATQLPGGEKVSW